LTAENARDRRPAILLVVVVSHAGIPWKYRLVEISDGSFPTVHINDRCALITVLVITMVLCQIGHIDADGKLFDQMRDPYSPGPDWV